ncbi:MAG: right-handed parallel beta-helix repeat-containing protein [Polyangiaceae bacterium]
MRMLGVVALAGAVLVACAKPAPWGPAPEPIARQPALPPPDPTSAGPLPVPVASGGAASVSAGPSAFASQAGAPGPASVRKPPTPTGSAYYVSPAGGGTACSLAAPCREISDALEHVRGGDVVFVADGTYRAFSVGGFRGTADAPLVIYAQGKAANVAPGDEDSIVVENSFYVTLDGLNASGAGRAGATVLCSNHVTIRNGRYTSNRRWGIFSGFADDITIDHNETAGSGREHGIYVSNSADRPIIRGNLAHDNANGGIQINADGSTLPDAKCAWLRAGGTVDGVCTGAVIEDNVIYGNGVRGGAAINLDGVQASIVRNNLLFENHASGIANFKENGTEGPKGMEILGNTVVQAKGARNALLFLAVAGPNRARDNILYHPDANKAGLEVGSAAEASILDSDYNVIDRFNFGETIVSLHDFQSTYKKEAHSISGATPAQLFLDPAGKAYALAPGSPGIGRGVFDPHAPTDLLGRSRPADGVDIGALQHR